MLLKSGQKDLLAWRVFENRESMGLAAALYTEGLIRALLTRQETIRMIFAAAPSQNEILKYLVALPNIPWERIEAFHMDEYLSLKADAPQRFGNFLKEAIFDRVPFRKIHLLEAQSLAEAGRVCQVYSDSLRESKIDICCLGIGENGHLAFNDPPVADFHDSQWVKVVPLDETCRRQQVHDGCFASLEAVPTHAITLTIPMLLSAQHMVCVVPAATKSAAISRLLTEESISEANPASILRTHNSAVLFLEQESGKSILEDTTI
ncbi:MAG: 6-phosphogluconolactonase [Planctomycetia bacterium]|nr:6-phosphogluconolactonase [Planctomycetia bacterium]